MGASVAVTPTSTEDGFSEMTASVTSDSIVITPDDLDNDDDSSDISEAAEGWFGMSQHSFRDEARNSSKRVSSRSLDVRASSKRVSSRSLDARASSRSLDVRASSKGVSSRTLDEPAQELPEYLSFERMTE